jgi:hypothetical protein
MTATKRTKTGKRVSYSFAEFADMVGKERTWVYRQVAKGRIRAITGFGAAMIPASEIERIFEKQPEAAAAGAAR